MPVNLHRIVIVGGGAGGLALATQLGDRLGDKGRAEITLVDRNETHLWKPLLHEIAGGSLDIHTNQLDYAAQARWHHFRFRLGPMTHIDRAKREITVGAVNDDEGDEMLPERTLAYDTLVLCVGSTVNYFGTPGAAEHAISLDSAIDAERFHRKLVAACMRANATGGVVNVVIIGAGATGVELSAELRLTTRTLADYGLTRLDPYHDVHLTLIESAPRILAQLPERLANATSKLLTNMNITLLTSEKVTELTDDAVRTASGRSIPAQLSVWAAGIKAPDWMANLGGLETNRINQLVVNSHLQTTQDESIFAFGDCAACIWPEKQTNIPPRAQSAHQQATYLVGVLSRRATGRPLPVKPFRYRDFGSLVSLGRSSTVGNLMGGLIGGSIFIEGLIARAMYAWLYKMHLISLHGYLRVTIDSIAHFLRRRTEPRVKLH